MTQLSSAEPISDEVTREHRSAVDTLSDEQMIATLMQVKAIVDDAVAPGPYTAGDAERGVLVAMVAERLLAGAGKREALVDTLHGTLEQAAVLYRRCGRESRRFLTDPERAAMLRILLTRSLARLDEQADERQLLLVA